MSVCSCTYPPQSDTLPFKYITKLSVISTYRIGFFCECVHEDTEQLIGIVDLLRVLADDPDKRRLGFWLVELVEVRA